MRTLASRRIALGCSLLWLVVAIPAGGQQPGAPAHESYPFPIAHGLAAQLAAVEPDGILRLVPAAIAPLPAGDNWLATEGHYLIASPRLLPGLKAASASGPLDGLVRVEVTEVLEKNALTARVEAEASKMLKPGDVVILVRPARMTTARIRALPAVIPLLKEDDPRAPQGLLAGLAEARRAARLSQSVNNLKQIGLALANFETAYGQFPPAVAFGPDGKPWHSWRVLILPFLDQGRLFNLYDFGQPWDSPRNRVLIDQMPAIYRDPQNGDAADSHAHYAALVGEKTAFPSRGARFTINNGVPSSDLYKGVPLSQVTDGTSITMAIAPVDPGRKIPWTKPEDISVDRGFRGLGLPGGIFTPGRIGGAAVAPVVFLDGSVRLLTDQVDLATLHNLSTINGGEAVFPHQLAGPPSGPRSRTGPGLQLHLIRDGKTVFAMIGPTSAP
jgi:hypothetical protein